MLSYTDSEGSRTVEFENLIQLLSSVRKNPRSTVEKLTAQLNNGTYSLLRNCSCPYKSQDNTEQILSYGSKGGFGSYTTAQKHRCVSSQGFLLRGRDFP